MKQLSDIRQRALEWFHGLSGREKSLVAAALILLVVLPGYSLGEYLVSRFQQEGARLAQLEDDAARLPDLLERYQKLQNQKRVIERRFEGAPSNAAIRSHLEKLAQSKADITSRINFQETGESPFGGKFMRKSLKVRFDRITTRQLAAFLEALANDPRPTILSRLEISARGGYLRFSAEISSIAPK